MAKSDDGSSSTGRGKKTPAIKRKRRRLYDLPDGPEPSAVEAPLPARKSAARKRAKAPAAKAPPAKVPAAKVPAAKAPPAKAPPAKAPAPPTRAPAATPRPEAQPARAVAVADAGTGMALPPIPAMAAAGQDLPQSSEAITVATATAQVEVRIGLPLVKKLRRTARVTRLRYWHRVSYQLVTGPAPVRQSVTSSQGISSAATESFAAVLGVAPRSLAASLSALFAEPIAIADADDHVRVGIELEVPAGKTFGVCLWQLAETYRLSDHRDVAVADWKEGARPATFPGRGGKLLTLPACYVTANEPVNRQPIFRAAAYVLEG